MSLHKHQAFFIQKGFLLTSAQQPRPHSPTGDLGEIAGVNGQNSEGMCHGGKPGTGKLYNNVCLYCSAHTSGCAVDGLGATAAF